MSFHVDDYRRCRWCSKPYIKDEGVGGQICSMDCADDIWSMRQWFKDLSLELKNDQLDR